MSASKQTMHYDEIRKHVRDDFINSLSKFKERVSVDGPMEGSRLDSLKASRELADEPLGDFLEITTTDGGDALLSAFCERRGITDVLNPEVRGLVQQEQRWSRNFGPVFKMDRLMRKTIHNDETKEPFA